MTEQETLVRDMHALYCAESGMDLPFRFGVDRAWQSWLDMLDRSRRRRR